MKRSDAEHSFNCLHVYCRLRDLHVPQGPAMAMGRAYEAIAHRILYVPGIHLRKNETGDRRVGKEPR